VWHLLAFDGVDSAAADFEQIPAVLDQIVTQSPNGNYILQQDMRVRAAYYRDAGATLARLNTPDWRRVSIPSINPVQRQAGVTNLPAYGRYYPGSIVIPKIDELIFQASNDGAGGVAQVGGLWISPLNDTLNIPSGDVYKVHAAATSTGIAGTWELVPFVLDQNLPTGTYAVIGLDVVQDGATGAVEFARLAWTGGAQAGGGQPWRPGVTIRHGFAEQNWENWQNGNWGTLGSFTSTAQPNLEVFSDPGTGVGLDIFMDIIQVSRSI
jgi:hypothetical protein